MWHPDLTPRNIENKALRHALPGMWTPEPGANQPEHDETFDRTGGVDAPNSRGRLCNSELP